jgi:hypothetical protein
MDGAGKDWRYSAFISHAKENARFADTVCEHLERRGLRCWVAPRDVRPGHEYAVEIVHGIENSKTLVVLLSKESNLSRFVKAEVERAYSKGRPVYPVRIEDVAPSPGLELFISTSHWIDTWRGDLEYHLDHLADTIDGQDIVRTAPMRPSGKRSKWPIYAAALVLLLGIGGAGAYFVMGRSGSVEKVATETIPAVPAKEAQPESTTTPAAKVPSAMSKQAAIEDEPARPAPPEDLAIDAPAYSKSKPAAPVKQEAVTQVAHAAAFVTHRVERDISVQDSPSAISNTIARLRAGDIVKVEDFNSSLWTKVHLDDGRVGYLPKDATRPF